MKQLWIKLSSRLDGMTLRERGLVFGAAVATVLFVLYTLSIEPLLLRQQQLLAQISLQNNQMTGIENEILGKVAAHAIDPDAELRARLKTVQDQVASGSAALMTMQKGLVAPERIAPLLEQLLRGNGKLQLIGLRSLPVAGLSEPVTPASALPAPAAAAKPIAAETAVLANVQAAIAAPAAAAPAAAAPAAAAKPRELLYRHGVEIVLQGNYLEMVSYMAALEGLPAQLFWGQARLEADHYPDARLTLTVYTLSLEQKWMKL